MHHTSNSSRRWQWVPDAGSSHRAYETQFITGNSRLRSQRRLGAKFLVVLPRHENRYLHKLSARQHAQLPVRDPRDRQWIGHDRVRLRFAAADPRDATIVGIDARERRCHGIIFERGVRPCG